MNLEPTPPAPRERELFIAALDQPDALARAAFLDRACGGDAHLRHRLDTLLANHQALGGFLETPARAGSAGMGIGSPAHRARRVEDRPRARTPCGPVPGAARWAGEQPGDRIGRYRLLERLGEGGCGVVYVAEQEEPVRRRVALKVIKLGMDTRSVIARFEAERQALAMMDHPNIAQVLDAGAIGAEGAESEIANRKSQISAGRPYFVMELVRGVRITDFCEGNRLSIRERLALFIPVCQAVQHAHQKGIIHRDLKPSNVLVTVNDGVAVPKVIDFGIAKATTGELLTDKTLYTAFEQFMGTPAYMSPEQATMTSVDIDTRSDIYSLGVLLYELLTGHTPFDTKELLASGFDEMRRIIREREPMRPSTRMRRRASARSAPGLSARVACPSSLASDLDWIVMKCLEKDRARRYETANGLARDIQRHLDHEPVVARPPGTVYRLQRFARRHWRGVTAGGAVVLALILGLAVATWMYLRESVAHDRALAAERRQRNLRQEVERARDRAERAERDALEQLRTSYIAEAQAHRVSGQPGRRFASLEVLAKAAALRPDLDVRNEVIACLPLLDLRLVRRWEFQARQERVFFEPTLDRYAVVNAGGNVSLRQWTDDAERNRLSAPSAHAGGGLALFSPDGRYLRVAYEKSMASHVWDLTDGALLLSTPHGHGEFTEDSRCFAVAEPASGITFYDLATRAKVGTLGAGSQFAFFRFDRAGRQLAAKRLGTNAEIVVIDLPTEAVTARLSDAQSVLDFAWHADGRHLAVANDVSQTVAIWDTRDGSVRQRLEGHQGSVVSLQFTRQGDLLFTSGWDGRIRVWDFQSGRELLNTSGAGRLLLSPDDRRLAVASWDGDRSWCFEVALSSGLRVIREAERGRDGGERVCFSRDGRVLARTFRGRVKLHDAATGRELAALDEHPIREVVADPQDNSFWLSGTGVWYRVPTGGHAGEGGVGLGALERIELPEDLVLGAIAADGRTLLAWRVRDERCVILGGGALRQQVEMKEPHPGIRYLALSPEGRWAATGAWQERVVKVWDAHSGDLLQTIATPDMASVAFSPDGRWLVIGSADYRFLEVGTWGEVRRVTRPPMEQFPPAMAFSRDGRMLALCHAERSIRLVDPHTGQELATLEAPDPWPVRTLSVNPDATQLAAGGEGTAEYHIWDLHQIRGQLAKLGLDWVATR